MVFDRALQDRFGAVWALDDVLEQPVCDFDRGQVVVASGVGRVKVVHPRLSGLVLCCRTVSLQDTCKEAPSFVLVSPVRRAMAA